MSHYAPTFSGLERSAHRAVEAALCSFFYIFLWVETLTGGMKPSTGRRTSLDMCQLLQRISWDVSFWAGSFTEILHTCHTGGTARWRCPRCSPAGRPGMMQGWHREHTGCNYSATHTSGPGWWHHTGYRTHTCRWWGSRGHLIQVTSKKDEVITALGKKRKSFLPFCAISFCAISTFWSDFHWDGQEMTTN